MITWLAQSIDTTLKNMSNGVVVIALTGVGIVMTIATAVMFTQTSRIDMLYMDSTTVKSDVARTATAVDSMRQDIADMKVTLKVMSNTLQSIDKRLASVDIRAQPTDYVTFADPTVLYTFLTKEKPAGPITVRSGNSNTMDMFKKLGK
jgi:hypothetical protein